MTAEAAAGDLSGITVALLRSPERAAATAAALTARGANPLVVPLIDWELPADTRELDRFLGAASSYDWLVVTSVTTVAVLAQRAEARNVSLRSLVGRARVAAVGSATRAALEALGLAVDLTPAEDQSAEGLLACLPITEGRPARAFLPQSDLAADTLQTGLTGHGWTVDAVTAYLTVDYPAAAGRRVGGDVPGTPAGTCGRKELSAAIRQGRVDAVVVTSPSIAVRLHAMMGALPESVVTVAIGRRTAREASALGMRIDATAASPSPSGIADAVRTAVVNHRKRN